MNDTEENQIRAALKEYKSQEIEVSHLLKFTQKSTIPGALPSSTHVVLTEYIEGVHAQSFKKLLEKRFDHVISLDYLERLAQSRNEREELSQPKFSAQSRSYRKRI